MSGDRHLDPNFPISPYAPKCKHCGKAFRSKGRMQYGSNKCRQAAYRVRLAAFLPLRHKEPLTRHRGQRLSPTPLASRKMAKGGAA